MPLHTVLRVSAATWLGIPLVLLAAFYIANFGVAADPYPLAVTSSALATLGFVVPLCAALGAWEGGRLRRGGMWSLPAVRRRAVIAAWAVGPVVTAGWLAVLAGTVVSAAASGVAVPDWRPLVVAFVVTLAHAMAGFAAGIRLPTTVAVAASLLLSFVWMVFLRGLDPMWLRHLNGGALELCCGTADDIAPGALAGPLSVAVGVILTALFALSPNVRFERVRVLTFAPLPIGLAIGALFVSGLSSYPTVNRDDGELVCADGNGVRVCVWPEHAGRLAEVTELAQVAADGWRSAGVTAPTLFTEGWDAPRGRSLSFRFVLRSSPSAIVNGLAYAMVPPWPACADLGPYPGYDAFEYVQAWYAARAGLAASDLGRIYGRDPVPGRPRVTDLLAVLMAQPSDVQLRWLAVNTAALASCALEPDLAMPQA